MSSTDNRKQTEIALAMSYLSKEFSLRGVKYNYAESVELSNNHWETIVYFPSHKISIRTFRGEIREESLIRAIDHFDLNMPTTAIRAVVESQLVIDGLVETAKSLYEHCGEEACDEFIRKYKLENEV